MPRGTYQLTDRVEAFSCAPGPVGWRYVSDRLDLACDSAWRPVRFAVASASGGQLRGGGARLDDGTPVLVWARTGPEVDRRPETITRADAVLTDSPGSWVALVRCVAAPGSGGAQAERTALVVEPSTLGAVSARYRLTRSTAETHVAPAGTLLVEVWHLDDLASGQRATLHVAGDVVVHAVGLPTADDDAEVSDLDAPPSSVGPDVQPETGR